MATYVHNSPTRSDDTGSGAAATLIGIIVAILLVVLFVYVLLPQIGNTTRETGIDLQLPATQETTNFEINTPGAGTGTGTGTDTSTGAGTNNGAGFMNEFNTQQ